MSDAERIVKKHGGTFTNGQWCRASGLTEKAAHACADDLQAVNYQVRHVHSAKGGAWEVLFR
jgi:hypothetical protein